jgi:hypothetical protein
VLYRLYDSGEYPDCIGGKTFIACGMEGGRVIDVFEFWRTVGGIANGGVVDKPNGGEYDIGTKAC